MKRATAFGLVGLQFVLLAALIAIPHGSLWRTGMALTIVAVLLAIAGLVIALFGILGLGSALTASPIPKDEAALVTKGIYGFARHPIYTGLIVGGFGLLVYGASVWHIVVWVALVVLLSAKSVWEERMLVAEHPDYPAYAARVGRFFPKPRRR